MAVNGDDRQQKLPGLLALLDRRVTVGSTSLSLGQTAGLVLLLLSLGLCAPWLITAERRPLGGYPDPTAVALPTSAVAPPADGAAAPAALASPTALPTGEVTVLPTGLIEPIDCSAPRNDNERTACAVQQAGPATPQPTSTPSDLIPIVPTALPTVAAVVPTALPEQVGHLCRYDGKV
jgi:hypothetical protein